MSPGGRQLQLHQNKEAAHNYDLLFYIPFAVKSPVSKDAYWYINTTHNLII